MLLFDINFLFIEKFHILKIHNDFYMDQFIQNTDFLAKMGIISVKFGSQNNTLNSIILS